MPKTILVTKLISTGLDSESLDFAIRHSDIIEIEDWFPSEKLIKHIKYSGCRLLLGLSSIPDRRNLKAMSLQPRDLRAAAGLFDYIELDAESDLTEDILNIIPARKRLITWRCNETAHVQTDRTDLLQTFRQISRVDAYLYRFITDSGITALEFLDQIKCSNVIAYAENQNELWSRIAAVYRGDRIIFADSPVAGPVSLGYLIRQFGLPHLPDVNELYGICGYPVTHSMSPSIHNAGFRLLNIPAIYLPFSVTDLDSLMQLIQRLDRIGFGLKGMTVTAPLKEPVSKQFPARREIVNKAQSANVLNIDNKVGQADSTDGTGLAAILNDNDIKVAGKKIAITGCGGSGRIAALVLTKLNAQVSLYNRSQWRARLAENLLGLVCNPLNKLDLSAYDMIVNTIPFPRSGDVELPFLLAGLKPGCVLIDYTYIPCPNALITHCNEMGLKVIDGMEMLRKQLRSQFQCLTGRDMSECDISDTLRKVTELSCIIDSSNYINNPEPVEERVVIQ